MAYTSSGPSKTLAGPGFIRLAIAGEAGLLLLAWALGRWLGISPAEQLRFGLSHVLWGVLATVPLLLALRWMLRTTLEPVRGLVRLVAEEVGPALGRCTPAELALLAAIAALSEEILFRGVIQTGLSRVMSPGWSLVLASGLFGLVHFASRAYAVLAALMGSYLGGLFLIQGSLTAPVVAHGIYDFVALLQVARRFRSDDPAN